MRADFYALLFILFMAARLSAQDAVEPKRASAVRIDGTIRIDGLLDDPAWLQAHPITDFIQKEPNEGAAPTEDMDVRILYDDGAIYFGARMYNRQTPMQTPLGRRDAVEQTEYLLVHLDTFLDRRTAYSFGVTAAGVRIDRYYPQDDETTFDADFDPVWQAKTNIEEGSWTAELWIPFSQLRFNAQANQVWGLNLQRAMPTINEMDYWVAVPRTERVWTSRFGNLYGIEGILPSKRIEALPYVAGSSTMNGNRDPANPLDDGRNLTGRTGADIKMGVGPNLTLEATVNPDFGQIEADPAEVNLTAAETFFSEKRPFFTEGARLLNSSLVNNFFYSRRIGAPPSAPVVGDYADYPGTSTILGAAKLTGRLRSGTSLGVLAAVTDEEFARVFRSEPSTIERIRVVPRTNYGLARIQQEFGPSGSVASAMVTALHRDFKPDDPLTALLPRNAFTVLGDSTLRFRDGQYELMSFAGLAYVGGEPDAIGRIQQSSVHYLQRPDKNYFPYDPTRRSLAGYKVGANFERTGGRHWLWNLHTEMESPAFNTNDMGRISSADGIVFNSRLAYRETTPGRIFRNYRLEVSQNNEWNRAGNRQNGELSANLQLTFLNFWTAGFTTASDFRKLDQKLTRGGPLMQTPLGRTITASIGNRPTARTLWSGSVESHKNEDGGRRLNVEGSVAVRSGSRWQLSVNPTYNRQTDSQQYVATLGGGRVETYGQRYIFSYINRHTWSTQLRMGYTLRPDINIDVYTEPFASSGRYYDFGELLAPAIRERRLYGTNGTTVSLQPGGSRIVTDGASSFTLRNYDFNVRSFRSNVVLRWEWRPGSTLYLVWQQNRQISEAFGDRAGPGAMFRSIGAPGSNFLAVKMSFWIPVK